MKHLDITLNQENQGWKYFLVFFVGLILGQVAGSIPIVVVIIIKTIQNGGAFEMPENKTDLSAFGIDPNFGLVLMIIPFVTSLIIAVLLIKSFHNRSFKEVINGGFSFRWKRFGKGFLIFGALIIIYMVVDILLNPGNFELQFKPASFIPLIVISFLLIPFQAGTEEFFFRGYLAQGVAAWTKNRFFVVLIPAICFALMHSFNPEVDEFGFWISMPNYLVFGLLFGIVSVLDDGIEMAVGMHASNNIFSSVLITSKSSVLQTPALYMQKEINPVKEMWVLFLISFLFLLISSYKSGWNFNLLFSKIKPVEKVEIE